MLAWTIPSEVLADGIINFVHNNSYRNAHDVKTGTCFNWSEQNIVQFSGIGPICLLQSNKQTKKIDKKENGENV